MSMIGSDDLKSEKSTAERRPQFKCIKHGSWRLKPLNKEGSEFGDDMVGKRLNSADDGRNCGNELGDVSQNPRNHLPMRAIVRHLPSHNRQY